MSKESSQDVSTSASEGRKKISWKARIKQLGFAGFVFFTIKGLLWLIIPYLIYLFTAG